MYVLQFAAGRNLAVLSIATAVLFLSLQGCSKPPAADKVAPGGDKPTQPAPTVAQKGGQQGNETAGDRSGDDSTAGVPSATVTPVAAEKAQPLKLPATLKSEYATQIVAFSPDGQLLAAGTYGGGIVLWSLETGRPGLKLEFPGPDKLLFSPDGRFVAAAGRAFDNPSNIEIGAWSVADGRRVAALQVTDAPNEYKASFAFAAKVALLAVPASATEIVVFDLASGKERSRCQGHTAGILDLVFGPGGDVLYSSSFDQSVRQWDLSQSAASARTLIENQYCPQLLLLGDGLSLATSNGPELFLWTVGGAGPATLVHKVAEPATGLELLDDKKTVALLGGNQPIVLWDSATKVVKSRMKGTIVPLGSEHKGTVLSRDGRTLAVVTTARNQATLDLWDVASGQRRKKQSIDFSHQPANCAISASGQIVAVGCTDGSILLFSTGASAAGPAGSTGIVAAKATLKHRSAVKSVGFSPDGKTVAVGLIPGPIQEQDAAVQQDLERGQEQFKKQFANALAEQEIIQKEKSRQVTIAYQRISAMKLDEKADHALKRQADLEAEVERQKQVEQRILQHVRRAMAEFYGPFMQKHQDAVPPAEVAELWSAESDAPLVVLEQPPLVATDFVVEEGSSYRLPGVVDPAKTPFGGPPVLLANGHLAWVHRRDGIQVVDLISRQTKAWKQSSGQQINWLISPNGKTLLVEGRVMRKVKKTVSERGKDVEFDEEVQTMVLALVDVATGKAGALAAPLIGPRAACFLADGSQVLAVAQASDMPDGKLVIRQWKVPGAEEIAPPLVVSGRSVSELAASPDGKWLATIQTIGPGSTPELRVLDLASGQERPTTASQNVQRPVWSPDSQTLAVVVTDPANDQQRVELVDLKTGQPRATIADWAYRVQSLAFSPDSRTIAIGGGSYAGLGWNDPATRVAIGNLQSTSELKLFDATSGKLLAPLAGHDDLITCVAFSPDGKLLASGGIDGQVKLWDVPAALKAGAVSASTVAAAPVRATPDAALVPAATSKSSPPQTASAKTATVKSVAPAASKPTGDTNSIGMKLVRVPDGEFQMGSSEDDPNADTVERPAHHVRLTKPFSIGAYEVTVGQFRAFVEASGYRTDAEKEGTGAAGYDAATRQFIEESRPEFSWRNLGVEQTDEHPVVNVSWNDAMAFCTWLSTKEKKRYRLPTEAEWEYACRAGTTTRFPTGDDDSSLKGAANIGDVSLKKSWDAATWVVNWNDGFAFTSPVGKWKPNAWGLYDMVGNAGEWTADWFDPQYYSSSPDIDPRGPSSGEFRTVRGGAWYYHPPFQRSAIRIGGCPPSSRNVLVGFRVVRED